MSRQDYSKHNPNYYMQASFLPISTTNALDKICSDFSWGEEDGKKKLHLVTKDITLRPKEYRGVGIRKHRFLNTIAMTKAKLGWKTCQGPSNLAAQCSPVKVCA